MIAVYEVKPIPQQRAPPIRGRHCLKKSFIKSAGTLKNLEKAGRNELKERIEKCRLPWEPENAQAMARALVSSYESGALRDFAERLH